LTLHFSGVLGNVAPGMSAALNWKSKRRKRSKTIYVIMQLDNLFV